MHRAVPRNVHEVARLLERRFSNFNHYNRKNPLDELLFILCSTKTSESGYLETFKALRRRFPSNRQLAAATVANIARTIQLGGLANKKAHAISDIMSKINDQFGKPTLSPLRRMSDADCEEFLTGLRGVGKKVARCVMMYSLDRAVFPVDVHCWRVAQRLGWIRQTRRDRSGSPRDEDRLQEKIPPELRFSLHVNFISLGRTLCTPRDPKCGACPIRDLCRQFGVPAIRPSRKARA